MVKIAVINSHPIQYFAPLYAHLNADPDIEITALYCSDAGLRETYDKEFSQKVMWDIDLLDGYSSIFLGKNFGKRTPGGFFSLICPEIWWEILNKPYDIIWLHGYNYFAYILAFFAAKFSGKRVFYRSETHLNLKRPKWLKFVRDGILRIFFRYVDSFLAIGSLNKAYYESLGVDPSKISLVPYTVDNERFARDHTTWKDNRKNLLSQNGLDHHLPTILFCSKLAKRKNPILVIDAVKSLKDQDCNLIIAGSGPLQAELKAYVTALGKTNIYFMGFVNQSELPSLYSAVDIFVLPSENEPWALVVNEVMAASLPVILGPEIGCVPDLVRHHENGIILEELTVSCLNLHFSTLLSQPQILQEMGKESQKIISNWSYDNCLDGIREGLQISGFKIKA